MPRALMGNGANEVLAKDTICCWCVPEDSGGETMGEKVKLQIGVDELLTTSVPAAARIGLNEGAASGLVICGGVPDKAIWLAPPVVRKLMRSGGNCYLFDFFPTQFIKKILLNSRESDGFHNINEIISFYITGWGKSQHNFPIYAKLSQQRIWPCYENGLINMIQTIPHNLHVHIPVLWIKDYPVSS